MKRLNTQFGINICHEIILQAMTGYDLKNWLADQILKHQLAV